ncbi:MAG: HYR domain-containing protein, partial [Bacteroidota bacterium]
MLLLCLCFSTGLKAHASWNAEDKTHVLSDIALAEDLPPTFSGCPPTDIVVSYTPGVCEATITWTPPTASPDAVSVTSNYSPGDSFLPGTTAVVYRAEDAGGNVTTCSFNVVVEDNENPSFTSFPSDVVINADPLTCTAPHSWTLPGVSDNCPAGEGVAPVLQDFESLVQQCYDFERASVINSGPINGSRNIEVNSFSAFSFAASSITTPVLYFTGDGEISFSHSINMIGDNAEIILDILDQNDNVVIANFFSEVYTTTAVQQENIPITFSGNRKIRIRYASTSPSIFPAYTGYLDDLLLPGTIVTNINDPSCDLAFLFRQRKDGTGKNSGDEFDVGVTTITYEVEDSAGNEFTQSFTITVINNLTPPTGQTDYTYCFGDPPPTLTVTVGPGETANWFDSFGSTVASNTTSYTPPATADVVRTYFVETVNAAGCSSTSRLTITLLQIPLPSTPSAPSPVSYCLNDTPSALTATPDADHVLNWYTVATGGTASATAPTPDTSASGSTSYWVSQTSNVTGCEGPRAEIVVDVYDFPAAPALTVGTDRLCVGDTPGNLDSYNNSGNPLTWYDAASGGNVVPGSTVPSTATAGTTSYWATQTTSPANCESPRRRLRIIVADAPQITSQPTSAVICDAQTVTFTAAAANSPNLQWQISTGGPFTDLTNTAPYSNVTTAALTIDPADVSLTGNRYRLVASSASPSCPDAISNEVEITVNGLPSGPGVTSPVNYCVGDVTSSLTATGSNLLWYTVATGGTGSATAPTPSSASAGTTSYWVSQTNGSGCEGPRSQIDVVVTALPSAPGVTSPVTYCVGDTASQLSATGTNLLWYTSPTGGIGNATAPTPSTASAGTTSYYVSQTNANGCEGPRAQIDVTINSRPGAPTVSSPVTYCQNDTASALTATGTNLLWYTVSSGGTGSATAPTPSTASVGTTSYYVSQTNANGCEGPRAQIDVTINAQPAAPGVTSPVNYCVGDATSQLSATGSNLLWYNVSTGGSGSATAPTPSSASAGTTSYWVSQTNGSGCESPRSQIDVVVTALPSAPGVTSPVVYCEGDAASALAATGTNLLWYTVSTGGTGSATPPTPSTAAAGTTSYYVSQTNANGCEGPRAQIDVTVNALPTIAVSTAPSCAPDLLTYSLSVNV